MFYILQSYHNEGTDVAQISAVFGRNEWHIDSSVAFVPKRYFS